MRLRLLRPANRHHNCLIRSNLKYDSLDLLVPPRPEHNAGHDSLWEAPSINHTQRPNGASAEIRLRFRSMSRRRFRFILTQVFTFVIQEILPTYTTSDRSSRRQG